MWNFWEIQYWYKNYGKISIKKNADMRFPCEHDLLTA